MSTNLPSMSVPFTDSKGRISPIWHEFLRSFVANSVAGTVVDPGVAPEIVAGNGLVGGGPVSSDVPLRVGQGLGIAVNADDVSVDINGATYRPGTLDDEILISNSTDNNTIKKTKLRDVAGLSSPGGIDSQVQYNSSGTFAANSQLTYNGAGALTIGAVTINGINISSATNADKFVFSIPGGTTGTHFSFTQSTGGSDSYTEVSSFNSSSGLGINNNRTTGATTTSTSSLYFLSANTVKWTLGLTSSGAGSTFTLGTTGLNSGNVFTVDATNMFMKMNTALTRNTVAGITASTTQTQGQGALTGEVNEISVCANTSDTVTLPTAVIGRMCLVMNHGAQTLQVFPATGADLGAGTNTATTIVAGSRKLFMAYSATKWEPVL